LTPIAFALNDLCSEAPIFPLNKIENKKVQGQRSKRQNDSPEYLVAIISTQNMSSKEQKTLKAVY
jgi:hypothetical protein